MGTWDGLARRPFSLQRASLEHYELVPNNGGDVLPSNTRRGSPSPLRGHFPLRQGSLRPLCLAFIHLLTPRRIFIFLACVLTLISLAILWSGVPPSYDRIREFERRLPQHNLSLPFPEGKDGMYLFFSEHLWGHGLNIVLQQLILITHLAYLSNRSFVFEDYTWSRTPFPYTIYDFALRPARIQLNAFISGPSAGGSKPVPRAVGGQKDSEKRGTSIVP